MRGIWHDIRFATRGFFRQPGFLLAALLSLLLGIGATTALFTLIDAAFLRPLPVDDLDRLAAVYQSLRNEAGEYTGSRGFSYPNFLDYRERQKSFAEFGLYQWGQVNLAGGGEPLRARGMYVTRNYFDLLGLEPAKGRFFAAGEGEPGGENSVAVLSHATWTRLFGADPAAVGSTIRVNGEPLEVIGVAPPGFRGTEIGNDVDVFLPIGLFERISPFKDYFEWRSVALFPGLGRLRDGVSHAQASTEMMRIAQELEEAHPKEDEGLGGHSVPLAKGSISPLYRDRYESYAFILGTAVLALLVIACLNVAGLLVVRGVERAREIAVRRALGAGRWRLVRQLLTENLFLFLVAGLLSLPVARFMLDFLWAMRPPSIAANALSLELDATVWLFALAVSLVVGLLFGLVPAARASNPDLVSHLKESQPAAERRGWPLFLRPRSLLVIVQVALALCALIGAGLFARNLEQAFEIDLGYDDEHIAVLTVSPGEQGYDEPQIRDYYRRLEERARALPGVVAAALSENRLLRGAVMRRQVFLPGEDVAEEIGDFAFHRHNVVGPGFFETAGIPLLAGRDFRAAEPEDLPVAIINRTMAERLWPGQSAVGQRFHFDFPGTPEVEVVGVVENAAYREVDSVEQFFIYRPLSQQLPPSMTLHARVDGDPATILKPLRETVQELDPTMPLADVATLGEFVAEALWLERSSALLLSVFGALALFLAVVGIYGLLAYQVSRRRREIGIAMALGAKRRDVVGSVLKEAVVIVVCGLVVGLLLAALALRPIIEHQLYGVSASDPVTYLQWTLALLLAALLGSLVPSWRAARTDPIRTLREE